MIVDNAKTYQASALQFIASPPLEMWRRSDYTGLGANSSWGIEQGSA